MSVNLWTSTEHARGYLGRADSIPHRVEGESTLLEFIPPTAKRILDLGTGDGRLLALIKLDHPDATATAIDFSPAMLEAARRRFVDDRSVTVVDHNLKEPLPELGIFDAIAPAAAAALGALTRGDVASFHDILAPTVPLSRHIFKAPTRFYKTGVVFMAYLNGLQDHFTLVGGQESARSTLHLAELFRLADAAGLLTDPELAAARMRTVMALRGVDA